MSTWNLGIDDVSEEAQAFKDKLASKDGHIAAQQTQLMRKAAELDELRSTLNDALHKLSRETTRVVQLEIDLRSRSEDLRNEKITSQNVSQALTAAQERIKAKDLEVRELQGYLDTVSHTSDGHSSRSAKLEREKSILEARVKELESSLRQLSCPPAIPGRTNVTRSRSPSLSNSRISALEQELGQARESLSRMDLELRVANDRYAQVQSDLIRANNEKLSMEKKSSRQLADIQALLEERDEELQWLKHNHDDESREAELLQRIEEDEAKIHALEMLLVNAPDMKKLEERSKRAEEHLREERDRVLEAQERHVELITEKEEALDELNHVREEISKLNGMLSQREEYINKLREERGVSATATDLIDDNTELLDMVVDGTCLTPVVQHTAQVNAVESIPPLLIAIERLRGERDTLRRNMDFLEHESKFTIEALEAKLAASSSSAADDRNELNGTILRLRAELDSLCTRVEEGTARESRIISEKDQEVRRLSLAVMASAAVISRTDSLGDLLERRLLDAFHSRLEIEDSFDKTQEGYNELAEKIKELEEKLEVTILCLETVTGQRNELKSQLDFKDEEREDEVGRVKSLLQEIQQDLEQSNVNLSDISKALLNVESERDSLSLQVTNLMADLRTAQEELTSAESRYSSLQFHQMSSMSSNEATRALQGQIQELEMRIMRRTEQIGIHQHDIKRLETNLRLSEEHIDELVAEMDMTTAQKNAMVEDCADAREARDEALARIDQLEAEIEARMVEGDITAASLVEIIIKTSGNSRNTIRRLRDGARRSNEELNRLRSVYDGMVPHVEKIPALEAQLSSSNDERVQLTLALAVSEVGLKQASISLQRLRQEKHLLGLELQNHQNDLDRAYVDVASLKEQMESLQCQISVEASDFATRKSELEAEIYNLQIALSNIEASHRIALSELENSKERQHTLDVNLEGEVTNLKAQHAEELSELQARLAETSQSLSALRKQYESAETDYQSATSEALKSKEELKRQLDEASEALTQSARRRGEMEQTQSEELSRFQRELDAALADATQTKTSRDELQISYNLCKEELTRLQQEQQNSIAHTTEESLKVQRQLEGEFEELRSNLEKESQKLRQALQEVDRIAQELQAEIEGRSVDKTNHENQLRLSDEQRRSAESSLAELSHKLELAQTRLVESRQELETLQEEKTGLQEEITTLEAEVQKSISFSRYLESQFKESENKAGMLASELEQGQADLARSEKAAKAAEVNLSLQGAQHKREMTDLQRELASIRSQPNLQNALAELEERNNEMEDLLRAKCAEIEQNDDRALEMLKDNKKLSTKVESLTRKVQNLQTKLAAAKAVIPNPATDTTPNITPPSTSTLSTSRTRSTFTDVPPVPPIPSYAPPSVTRAPLNRVVSGPSTISRPKTPERRAPPPVFKARTPERRAASMLPSDPMPSSSTIGKKRRAPDDFEACESVPPQGFTTESLPSKDLESTTPRLRKAFSSIQSGFTPVRNQTSRPTVTMPSPKRASTTRPSPPIADVTNSPRAFSQMLSTQSEKAKRSWLGKIRGVSIQASGRAGETRARFEQGEAPQ